jgi:hypothetical protein
MYNSGAGGLTSVRMETGNLLPADYPDTELTLKLQSAFSRIQLAVGRVLTDPFISTDTEYDFARELELKIAAKDALKAYGPEFLEKVKELDAEITADIAFLKENVQEPGGGEDANILFGVTPYLSYGALLDEDPTNELAVPYRSGLTDDV